jgi:hypothetical protein
LLGKTKVQPLNGDLGVCYRSYRKCGHLGPQ